MSACVTVLWKRKYFCNTQKSFCPLLFSFFHTPPFISSSFLFFFLLETSRDTRSRQSYKTAIRWTVRGAPLFLCPDWNCLWREKRRSSRAAAVSKMYNSLSLSSFMGRRSTKKTHKKKVTELLDQKGICGISSSCPLLNQAKAANIYNISPLSSGYISILFSDAVWDFSKKDLLDKCGVMPITSKLPVTSAVVRCIYLVVCLFVSDRLQIQLWLNLFFRSNCICLRFRII